MALSRSSSSCTCSDCACWGGALLVVDLRMLGFGFSSQPIAGIAQDVRPWLLASLVVMVATGTALFLSESVKC